MGIARSNHAIAVAVVGRKGLKSVGGCTVTAGCRRISEEFTIIVDDAIAIQVDTKESCISGCPSGRVPDPFRRDVPIDGIATQRRKSNSGAGGADIHHEWRSSSLAVSDQPLDNRNPPCRRLLGTIECLY